MSRKDEPKVALVGWLVSLEGPPWLDEDYRLRAKVNRIGSSPECDIYLNDEEISHEHVAIKFDNGKFSLTDLVSTNGTFVNGEKVENCQLEDDHEIRIGHCRFRFKKL